MSSSDGGVSLPPTPQQLHSALESSIWYHLSLWPALHIAVQHNWGGPNSSDKLDWFAGAVSSLFDDNSATDFDDLVIFLLQVMQDEFELNVEDDSEEEVARGILGTRRRLFEDGDLSAARDVEMRWKGRGKMKTDIKVEVVDGEVDGDGEDLDWVEDDDDEDVDVEMEDAGEVVPAPKKEKPAPEVDEDGFTKVTKKRTR